MMLFAEHLQKISGLRRVYFLDDDIEKFYRYNRMRAIRDYVDTNICDALNFMRAVLDTELNKQKVTVPTDKEKKSWLDAAYHIIASDAKKKADVDDLILSLMEPVIKNKDKLLDLLTKIDREELKEMKEYLSGKSVKKIGNVALHNKEAKSDITYRFRLDKENDNIRYNRRLNI